MRAGVSLLKTYESSLIALRYEDLLHFLINDLIKSGFFGNKNYEQFLKVLSETRIKTELVNNLENEHFQDEKIKAKDEKKK